MDAFYSDNDKKACAWLRELMKSGLISEGVVDERSICDLQPSDLRGFRRVHLFAGIGGWELAIRLAGWPAEPVWTGSCPCQPFSAAGKQQGQQDSRHLWPEMFRLIRECRPVTIFGEQVPGAIRFGWLDGVFADLEGEGYTCGATVLGAHSVGAPHIRQRLYWVAYARHEQSRRGARPVEEKGGRTFGEFAGRGNGLMGNTISAGLEEWRCERGDNGAERQAAQRDDAAIDFWASSIPILCRDGKYRRIPGRQDQSARLHGADGTGASIWEALYPQPGLFPLAHGVPGRVGLLRGAGNAIVPQAASVFIRAFLKSRED